MVIAGSTAALKEAKRTARRWTPADAIAIFPALSALGEDCGFRVALLGGTFTRGDGGDLDCALLPLHGAMQNKQAFLIRFGGQLVRSFRDERLKVEHVHVVAAGRLYDFSFGVFWDPGELRKWARKLLN